MIGGGDLSAKLALDARGLEELKRGARDLSPQALKAAARQFEAIFLNMLMKSMREATPQNGLFDSEQTRMYTSMLDQQLTQRMVSRGVGLADVMVRQLSHALPNPALVANGVSSEAAETSLSSSAVTPDFVPKLVPAPRADTAPADADAYARASILPPAPASSRRNPTTRAHVDGFVQRLMPHAQAASAGTGIPAHFMIGQAALETGWGKSEIRDANGRPSHNLFGIKAGRNWQGRTVDVVTTEYVNGKPQKQVERFRAYDSYADSFRDYANLLRSNRRYENVLARGHDIAGFAQGLQQAGYATDPNYADKLMRVIKQVDLA